MKRTASQDPGAIPGGLNLCLLAVALGVDLALLAFASRTESWAWRIAAGVAFSFVNNTVFSLLHEAVHGHFHARRAVNEWGGRITAAFFPTGLTFQRLCHLGHHRRNRTDAELFDYVLPGESRLVKTVQWYGILTGVYWLLPPLACLAYLIFPPLFRASFWKGSFWKESSWKGSRLARQTSAEAMLSGFENAPERTIRGEILFTVVVQLFIVRALGLTAAGWLTCYAAFALNWSALQYADHAWSSRDVHDGAWNLRVHRIVQLLFLNYHHHRAHHQNPQVPWLHLPKYVDLTEERPSFLRIYLSMWRGPRLWPDDGASDVHGVS